MRRMQRPKPEEPTEDTRTESQLEAEGELKPVSASFTPDTGSLLSKALQESLALRHHEGNSVTVTWGEELFSPIQFNTCRVGPFSLTTPVHKGETTQQALLRAHEELSAFVAKVRSAKVKSFREEMVALGLMRA